MCEKHVIYEGSRTPSVQWSLGPEAGTNVVMLGCEETRAMRPRAPPSTQLHTHSSKQHSRCKLYPTNPNWLSLLLSATTRGGAVNLKLVQTLDRGWLLVSGENVGSDSCYGSNCAAQLGQWKISKHTHTIILCIVFLCFKRINSKHLV